MERLDDQRVALAGLDHGDNEQDHQPEHRRDRPAPQQSLDADFGKLRRNQVNLPPEQGVRQAFVLSLGQRDVDRVDRGDCCPLHILAPPTPLTRA